MADRPASCRCRAPLVRLLAWTLLISITYPVTLGSAHSHRLVQQGYQNEAANSIGRPAVSAKLPSPSHSTRHECLTCLLQQQLFSSALHKVLSAPIPESAELVQSSSAIPTYFSIANSPQHGR